MKKGDAFDRLQLMLILYSLFCVCIVIAPTKDGRVFISLGAISICFIVRYLAGILLSIEDNGLMLVMILNAGKAEEGSAVECLAVHRRECDVFYKREIIMSVVVFLLSVWGIGSSCVF